ncbi:hypothetical protein C0J52_12763 [Blattella germanica]|nr:hypothetical protein C0J52_12763 [Blattella germanica]
MYSDVARKPYVIEVNGLKIRIQHTDNIQNHITFFRQQTKCLNSQVSAINGLRC